MRPRLGAGARLDRLSVGGGWKSVVVRYGLAVGSFVLLLLLSFGIRRFFGFKFDSTSLVILTMIGSAWYLGLGPGLLIALLFEAVIDYFAPPQLRSIFITFNRMVLFVSVVLFASWGRRALREREHLLARERAARAEAEEANRLKDEFLATVSHELRTPLTAILGWAAMLTRGALAGEAARNACEVIERNAKAQAGIVNDILDVSRIITGKLHIDPRAANLAPIVSAAVHSLHPATDAKAIHVSVSVDQTAGLIVGDPDRLQQVVWNLLSNAIKFTPEGGSVGIRLARVDAYIELRVSDTGVGISEQFLPHVFERFRQADSSTTRKHGGLGLGLAIVRHLVELHGGTIHAESEGSGQGSTFTLSLPLASALIATGNGKQTVSTADAEEKSKSLVHSAVLDNLRILIVEDEADTRELVREVLARQGAEVRATKSAAEGLQMLAAWNPDLLVSDIGMPGQDGYELIRRVRKLDADHHGQIPAVALTAYAGAEDQQRALAAGFQIHLAKPVEPKALVATVARLVGRETPVDA